jgi:predicted RNase H-like HicB family nuclease
MIRQRFRSDPHYLESVRGLHRLHALAVAEREDTPEADAVRDALSGPWLHLTEAEKARITGLSEDLYSISEPPGEVLPMAREAQRKLGEALVAAQVGDWDQALGLLRRWGRCLEPAVLSRLRALIWMEAGDPETAALFFQHAARLDPTNDTDEQLTLLLDRSQPTAQEEGGESMPLTIHLDREGDGRWIAEVPELPGVLAYGQARHDAIAKAKALTLRAWADRIEQGEPVPEMDGLFTVAS